MRDGAQTLGARILVGLIVVVLTVFGFGAFDLFAVGEPVAATVNGTEIAEVALEAETERRRRDLLARMGDDADPSLIDAAALREATLDSLIHRTLLLQLADALDVAVSDARMGREIAANAEFQVDGKFNEDRFRATLAAAGFSPRSYQEQVVADARVNQLTAGVADTVVVAEQEVRDAARVLLQRRDVAYLAVATERFKAAIEVAEEDIAARYDAELDRYRTPLTLDVDYARLSFAAVMAAEQVTEEALRVAFDAEEQARLTAPDMSRRRGAHILLEVGEARSEAEAIERLGSLREEIEAGADFAAKARELSEDPGSAANGGDLGLADRDTFVTPFADALWALAPGDLSMPVVTQFGVHLITLLEVEDVAPPTFEESRDGLELTLRRQAAEQAFDELLRQMDEIAFEEPDSLAGIAQALSLTIETVAGVTRDDGAAPFTEAGLRGALFEADVLAEGYNTPAIRVGEDAVVARIATRHEPKEQPLAEVEAAIRDELVAERAREEAAVATLAALSRLRDGEDAAAISERLGGEWVVEEGATRMVPTLPEPILAAAFKLDPPVEGGRAAIDVETPPDGHALVVVTRVQPGDFAAMSESDRTGLRDQLVTLAEERELGMLLGALRADADID